MIDVSARLALVPGAPVLVPELGGAAAAEMVDTLEAATAAAGALPAGAEVVVVGCDEAGRSLGDVAVASRRWGVPVRGGHGAPVDPGAVPDAALVAWWLLDRAGHRGPRRFVSVTAAPADAVDTAVAGASSVLVVADGPAALTPRAPIPRREDAVTLDGELTRWLAGRAPLPTVDDASADAMGWWTRSAWRVADRLRPATEPLLSGSWAPFGVGYHVGAW